MVPREIGSRPFGREFFGICLENSLNFVGHACSVTDQSRHVKNVTYIFVLEDV